MNRQYITQVLIPLLIGGSIYILFRSKQLYLVRYVYKIGGKEQLTAIRKQAEEIGEWLPSWVLHTLPDALWLYAFASFMYLLWQGAGASQQWLWSIMPLLVALIWEIGQAFHWWKGTFDWWDMAAYSIVSMIIIRKLSISK